MVRSNGWASSQSRIAETKIQEEINRKLLTEGDSGKLLGFIARSAAEALPGAFIHILTLDDQRASLRIIAAQTLTPEPAGPKGLIIPLEGTVAGRVATLRETVVLPQVTGEEGWSSFDWLRSAGISWYVGLPLESQGEVLGALSCFGGLDKTPAEEVIDTLRVFAYQAAIALSQIRLKRELETFKARLLQSERYRTLGAMMRGVSHDLNNILGIILNRAQLLMLDNNGAESLKNLENIERASMQGAHCIRRILEFTKSAQDVEVARLDLAATLEEVVAFTRGRWHDEPALRGVKNELKCGFPNDLPNIQINEAEIREVIAELIYNAVDAMPQGGTLTISADVEEEMLVVRFTDTGVGMSEATTNRVFEPYFTTKGVDGTGLGLANVRSIVERNAGRIGLKSVPGHGTTVSIYLPLEGISLQEFLPFESDDSSRILEIAGKAEVRELLERVLRMDGHEVIAPPDAEAAAAVLQNSMEKLDLILMDRRMGGKGFEQVIERTASDPRAIFFSSWGRRPKGENLPDSSDADLSLMQPFSVARVIETVRETLQLRKA